MLDLVSPRTTLSAWRVSADALRHEAHPLRIDNHLPLDQLARDLAAQCQHKDHFAIRCLDLVSQKGVVHFYAVRAARPTWQRDPSQPKGGRMIAQIYPDLLFTVAVDAFQPVEPWAWAPGADVVGAGPVTIEGNAV